MSPKKKPKASAGGSGEPAAKSKPTAAIGHPPMRSGRYARWILRVRGVTALNQVRLQHSQWVVRHSSTKSSSFLGPGTGRTRGPGNPAVSFFFHQDVLAPKVFRDEPFGIEIAGGQACVHLWYVRGRG